VEAPADNRRLREYEPANILAQDGHVVGNDKRAKYTGSTPVRRPSDRTIQASNLSRAETIEIGRTIER